MSDTEHEPDENEPVAPPDLNEEDPGDDIPPASRDEEEPELVPEPEPEPEPHGLTEKELEARFKKAETAMTTYARRIGDIYGDDAIDLIECPLCPSIHKGFLNRNDAGRVPDDVKNAAMLFLGYAQEVEYAPDPNTNLCNTCGGEGKVERPTKVAKWKYVDCPRCLGYGFLPPPSAPGNGVVASGDIVAPPEFEPAGAGVPDVDPSQEPRLLPDGRENPNYGKWPQYKVPVAPWGITAGLTAQDAIAL